MQGLNQVVLIILHRFIRSSVQTRSTMPQVIRCPNCTTAMQVADNSAGKQFRCPSCKKPVTVPAAAPKPVAVGAGRRRRRPPPSSTGSVSLGNLNLPPVPAPRRQAVGRRRVHDAGQLPRLRQSAAARRHLLHGLRLPAPARRQRPAPRRKGRRRTSVPTRPAASPTRPASATASAAARRCRPPPAP